MEDTSIDKFLPRKEKLRIVWFAGLNSKILRRDYEKIDLVRICSDLMDMQELSLCRHSLFLVGGTRVLERQMHFLHSDLNKFILRLKLSMKDLNDATLNHPYSRITLPDPLRFVSAVFGSANETSFTADYHYLPDSEFFLTDSNEIEAPKHTVASPLDITLPDDNLCSVSYSLHEPEFGFAYNFNADIQSNELQKENCIDVCHNESAAVEPPDSLLMSQLLFESPDNSVSKFVSPLANIVDQPARATSPVLKKKTVKRRLTFDNVTELTDQMMGNNGKSWTNTLGYKKFFNKLSSSQLLTVPVDSSNVYSNAELLRLWQNNAVVCSSTEEALTHEQGHESVEFSVEVPRAIGRSLTGYSEIGEEKWTSVYSDKSANATHHVGQSSLQRMKGSTMPGIGKVGFLPTIPDFEAGEIDNINTTYDEPEQDHDELELSKSQQFYYDVLLPKMRRNEKVSFSDLLSSSPSKHAASLFFMHVLELAQKGLLSPRQAVPYEDIKLMSGK